MEPLSRLSGLITRALESADQLAASTRRTRKGTRVAPGEAGSSDTADPMTAPAAAGGTAFASATLWIVDLDGVIWLSGQPIGDVAGAVDALRTGGRRVVFATNNSAPTTAELVDRLGGCGVKATSR